MEGRNDLIVAEECSQFSCLVLQSAAAAIDAKANVCCVQFSPTDANLMAFGGANYRTYVYDLRHIQVRFLLCWNWNSNTVHK